MQSIAPCRSQVSDRFPVASFDIAMPRSRYFEVACATDPRLFHSEFQRQRTASNFFSSRAGGLMHVPEGRTAWFLPPSQLRRFAGAKRIYYALASYGSPLGAQPEFSISPYALERVPSIALAADFTGRTLDRSRLSGFSNADAYGSVHGASLRWGGDDVLEAERMVDQSGGEYDDGHSPELWQNGGSATPHETGVASSEVDPDQGAYDAGVPREEIAAQAAGLARALENEEMACADDEDEGLGYGARTRPRHYGEPVDDGDDDDDDDDDTAMRATGAGIDDDEGYEDAASLYGAVGFNGGSAVAVEEPPVSQRVVDITDAVVGEGRDPGYRDELDEEEVLPAGAAARALDAVPLDIAEKVRILRVVGIAESGADGYAAINPDNEYNDPKHPAYHKYHIGLSWGLIQFTQRSGALGRVLQKVQARDAKLAESLPEEQTFSALFGPSANELVTVTNDADPEVRVGAVGGALLWEPAWTARFRAAGNVPHVTWSQNEVAITDYFDPLLNVANWLGFDTARALSMLVDRCIHMGRGGGLSWVLKTIGPVKSEADRAAALAALGYADVRAFQTTVPDLKADGKWGPLTHAAMIGALRSLGTASPLVVDDVPAMLQQMVDAARTTRFAKRLTALHSNTTDFSDATSFVLV